MKDLVFNAVMLSTTIPINKQNLFIVWSCYILGYMKFLVGALGTDNYYEVTYNKTKDEWYVDEYRKASNTCIRNLDLKLSTEINNKAKAN